MHRMRITLLMGMVAVGFAAVLAACAACSTGGSGGNAPSTTTSAGLAVEVVASGLSHPWDVGFLPDGRLLVPQRPGRISLVEGGRVTDVEADLGDVAARGEGGLMSLVVHPDYATSRRFTTCSNTSTDVRLVTWELDGAKATRVKDPLLAGLPTAASGRHSGCRMALDRDGHLLVGTGDTAKGGFPQDRTNLGGKGLIGGPATAFDFDRDGLLDVFIGYFGNYLTGELPTLSRRNTNALPDKLFRNKGNFAFEDVSKGSGVENTGWAQSVGHLDFDGDGDVRDSQAGADAPYGGTGDGDDHIITRGDLVHVELGPARHLHGAVRSSDPGDADRDAGQ